MNGTMTLRLGGLAGQSTDTELTDFFRSLMGARRADGPVTVVRDASIVTLTGPVTVDTADQGQALATQLQTTPVPNVLVMSATFAPGFGLSTTPVGYVNTIAPVATTPTWVWVVAGVAGVAVVGGGAYWLATRR